MSKKKQGKFQVISSLVVHEKNEFHVVGKLKEGLLKDGWYITIPLNAAISLTIRITQVLEVGVAGNEHKNTLLVVASEADMLAIFEAANLKNVECQISADGEN
ncbi:MAG: hypothetical protein ACRCYO_17540 [Bacteroidia bacterium]